jgi:hypothetical protein
MSKNRFYEGKSPLKINTFSFYFSFFSFFLFVLFSFISPPSFSPFTPISPSVRGRNRASKKADIVVLFATKQLLASFDKDGNQFVVGHIRQDQLGQFFLCKTVMDAVRCHKNASIHGRGKLVEADRRRIRRRDDTNLLLREIANRTSIL